MKDRRGSRCVGRRANRREEAAERKEQEGGHKQRDLRRPAASPGFSTYQDGKKPYNV